MAQLPETTPIDLSQFRPTGLDRGRGRTTEILWWVVKLCFIQSSFPWPMRFKRAILRAFGATIGSGFYIRPRVNIHFPWKLTCGDNVWIGESTTILNLEQVELESNVALAHEVYIAAAGHDVNDPLFSYANAPVLVQTGAWLATRSYVGPGVTVGRGAVLAAGAVAVRDVDDWTIVGGVPAKKIGKRDLGRAK